MKFRRATLAECPASAEAVIVIDVCRAFTTAAFALAAGASKIIMVQTVEEAFQLRQKNPGWLLAGEVNGLPVSGFDLWNSPHDVEGQDLTDKTLVLRTSSGTQGVVRCRNAGLLLAGSFVVAEATAAFVRKSAPDSVTFLLTGVKPDQSGVEDIACADYLQELLQGTGAPVEPFLQSARGWNPGRISGEPEILQHLQEDLSKCLQANRFDFYLKACLEDGYPILVLPE